MVKKGRGKEKIDKSVKSQNSGNKLKFDILQKEITKSKISFLLKEAELPAERDTW